MTQKLIIYKRASTDKQAYDQQLRSIDKWLTQAQRSADKTFEEKESGSKKHTERVLLKAIEYAEKGDMIVVSEFSRLSRSMSDMSVIVDQCIKKGIDIISIKENVHIKANDPNDIVSKLLVMVFGISAEIELQNIRSRTQSGLNVIKDRIKKDGYAIGKKSGRRFEKLGNPRLSEFSESGCDASAISRRKKKVQDIGFRQTYSVAALMRDAGSGNEAIAFHLNESGYKTPRGCAFLPQTVSRLLRDGDKLLKSIKKAV